MIEKSLKYLKLNPEHGLIRQPMFWLSIILPVILFLLFGIPVWFKYSLCFTVSCYKQFLEVSQLPIYMLALAVPLSILVSRAHATEQTASQIMELMKNNRIDRFYKDRDEFKKSVSRKMRALAKTKSITNQSFDVDDIDDISYYAFVNVSADLSIGVNEGRIKELVEIISSVSEQTDKVFHNLSDDDLLIRLNDFCMLMLDFHTKLPSSMSLRLMYQMADVVPLQTEKGLKGRINVIPLDTTMMKEVELAMIVSFFKHYDSVVLPKSKPLSELVKKYVEMRRRKLLVKPIDIRDLDVINWNQEAFDKIPIESDRLSALIEKYRVER